MSMLCVLRCTVSLHTHFVSSGVQNISSGMPVAFGTSEGVRGVQAWISVDFGWISGSHYTIWTILEQHMCCFLERAAAHGSLCPGGVCAFTVGGFTKSWRINAS